MTLPNPQGPSIKKLQSDVERLRARLNNRTLADFYGPWLGLPALRGQWVPGLADNTGAVYDRTGQGRTLTYNGNPTLSLYNDTIPYWDYDGVTDCHSRPDETGLDITGGETTIAAAYRGLTVGGWFWADSWVLPQTDVPLIGKHNAVGNQRGYVLYGVSGVPRFRISGNGTNTFDVDGAVMNTGEWYFLVGRFDPSTEIALWVNTTKTINTTTIPATIFANTAPLAIGAFGSLATFFLDGRWSLGFVSAAYWPDALIEHLFDSTHRFMQL